MWSPGLVTAAPGAMRAGVDVERIVSRIESEIHDLDTGTFLTVGVVLVLLLALSVRRINVR